MQSHTHDTVSPVDRLNLALYFAFATAVATFIVYAMRGLSRFTNLPVNSAKMVLSAVILLTTIGVSLAAPFTQGEHGFTNRITGSVIPSVTLPLEGLPSASGPSFELVDGLALAWNALLWATLLFIIVIGTLSTVLRCYVWYLDGDSRCRMYSYIVEKFGYRPLFEAQDCRSGFRGIPRTKAFVDDSHTHGSQASERSEASTMADRLSMLLGLEAHFHQKSKSDVRFGRNGSRTYYWKRDLDVPYAGGSGDDPMGRLHVMIDIDYYYDMPTWLSRPRGPVLLYTFQPSEVARDTVEYSYSFNSAGMVTYNVSGGSRYEHDIWSYNSDTLSATSTLFGIPFRTTTYNIDKRYMDKDHQLVLLTPVVHFGVIGSILASWLSSNELSRLRMFDGEFNVLRVRNKSEMQLSVARPNTLLAATLPLTTFDGLNALAHVSKYDINQHQVYKQYDDELRSAVLLDYIKAKRTLCAPVIAPVEDAVNRYVINPPYVPLPSKPGMTAFMRPIVIGSYVPDINLNNEKEMISERVEKPRAPERKTHENGKHETVPPNITRAMREFIKRLVPNNMKHSLKPCSIEEVYDKQTRPTQRRILDTADLTNPARVIRNFPKKEPYTAIKPPRPISQINGTDKLHYSRYTYVLSDYMHNFNWYAFGVSNRSICERVAAICSNAKHVVKSDFSKFDGHIGWIPRELELAIWLELFGVEFHTELIELHQSQFGMKAYCTLGSVYDQFFARASGSPETSIMNSLVNAFVNFFALYMMDEVPHNMRADWAWGKLGLYGGDDGLTPDVDSACLLRAAKLMNLEIAAEPVLRGKYGVSFLARDYSPDVWFGDKNSMCSLLRQLSKLHLTVHLPSSVTPAMKLAEKLLAYSYTDHSSPVFNHLIKAFQRILGDSYNEVGRTDYLDIWNKESDLDKQYINEEASWMFEAANIQMPGFNFVLMHTWLSSANTVEDLLNGPVLYDPESCPVYKHTYIVNGKMVLAAPAPEPIPNMFDPTRPSTEPDRMNSIMKIKPLTVEETKPVKPEMRKGKRNPRNNIKKTTDETSSDSTKNNTHNEKRNGPPRRTRGKATKRGGQQRPSGNSAH